MSNWIIVILCAVAAVALFVAGMSLTLMLKGHHIDSEISTNKEMQRRGIKCGFRRCGILLFPDTDAAGSENR